MALNKFPSKESGPFRNDRSVYSSNRAAVQLLNSYVTDIMKPGRFLNIYDRHTRAAHRVEQLARKRWREQ